MDLGMPEMIFIFFLALIILGPKRLPELARQLGKITADLKRASNDFTHQLKTEIDTIDVEEQRKKFKDRTEELWKDAQAGFAINPPADGGVARTLSQAGVEEKDLAAPQTSVVESAPTPEPSIAAPIAESPAETPQVAKESVAKETNV